MICLEVSRKDAHYDSMNDDEGRTGIVVPPGSNDYCRNTDDFYIGLAERWERTTLWRRKQQCGIVSKRSRDRLHSSRKTAARTKNGPNEGAVAAASRRQSNRKRDSQRDSKHRSKQRRQQRLWKQDMQQTFLWLEEENDNYEYDYDDYSFYDDYYPCDTVFDSKEQAQILLANCPAICHETMARCLTLYRQGRADPKATEDHQHLLLSKIISLPTELQHQILSYRYTNMVTVEKATTIPAIPGIYFSFGWFYTCCGSDNYVDVFILYPDLTRARRREWFRHNSLKCWDEKDVQRLMNYALLDDGNVGDDDIFFRDGDPYDTTGGFSFRWHKNADEGDQDDDGDRFTTQLASPPNPVVDGLGTHLATALREECAWKREPRIYYLAIPFSSMTFDPSWSLSSSLDEERQNKHETLTLDSNIIPEEEKASRMNPWFSPNKPWFTNARSNNSQNQLPNHCS